MLQAFVCCLCRCWLGLLIVVVLFVGVSCLRLGLLLVLFVVLLDGLLRSICLLIIVLFGALRCFVVCLLLLICIVLLFAIDTVLCFDFGWWLFCCLGHCWFCLLR